MTKILSEKDIGLSTKQVKAFAGLNIDNGQLDDLIPFLAKHDPENILDVLKTGYKVGTNACLAKDGLASVSAIINDTMEFADVHTTRENNINDSIERVLRLMEGDFRKNNVLVFTDFDRSIPSLNVRHTVLDQVYVNLFANAIYAMNDIEGARELSVTTRNVGPAIKIIISDTGHGIEEDIKDKIFQPFFTTKPEGCGKGMGICITDWNESNQGGAFSSGDNYHLDHFRVQGIHPREVSRLIVDEAHRKGSAIVLSGIFRLIDSLISDQNTLFCTSKQEQMRLYKEMNLALVKKIGRPIPEFDIETWIEYSKAVNEEAVKWGFYAYEH